MKQEKNILKAYFETGDKPTQKQYENLIDSLRHAYDPITVTDLEIYGYSEENTRETDIIVKLGDYDNSSNGTKLIVNDANKEISIKGALALTSTTGDVTAIEMPTGSGEIRLNLPTTSGNIATNSADNHFAVTQTFNGSIEVINGGNIKTTGKIAVGAENYLGYLTLKDQEKFYLSDNKVQRSPFWIQHYNHSQLLIGQEDSNGNLYHRAEFTNIQLKVGSGQFNFPSFSFLDDHNTGMYNPAQDNLAFSTNSIPAYQIDDSQNHDFKSGAATFGGSINANGGITAANYISSDGSLGYTGNFIAGPDQVTVKNGIITDVTNIS